MRNSRLHPEPWSLRKCKQGQSKQFSPADILAYVIGDEFKPQGQGFAEMLARAENVADGRTATISAKDFLAGV